MWYAGGVLYELRYVGGAAASARGERLRRRKKEFIKLCVERDGRVSTKVLEWCEVSEGRR